jgi:tRNA 2-thiouridine synthesizing protein A
MKENPSPRCSTPVAADLFDAGPIGCGELVLKLKIRMTQLEPGQVLHLIALDTGAVEDIPAWCQMTRHRMVLAQHPDYWIERKAN